MEQRKLFKLPENPGWLRKDGLSTAAKRILGTDYRWDEKTGRHFVRADGQWQSVTFSELLQHAGIEQPINGNQ